MHGRGRLEWANGTSYEGGFDRGLFSGDGVLRLRTGAVYRGEFRAGRMSGRGRMEVPNGDVYEGNFEDGELNGAGRMTAKGASYEGTFRGSRPHGTGVLKLPGGDVYKGAFERGVYHGEGVLTYGKPQPDGRTEERGTWRYGRLYDAAREKQSALNVETALYGQRALLDRALASLEPRDASKINMYLLAVAGDGAQEVFRREVQFVRAQFDRELGTHGRSVALVNSRTSVASDPMATVTSIREALQAIAARMDRENDILFLFVTSHGSDTHELTLAQNNMQLRGLPKDELARLLEETKIRWKVVVISACYSGGFIDALKNDHTLVITAARHDRTSFGCSDTNDFTYFGRAFFRDSVRPGVAFADAFRNAERVVHELELEQAKELKLKAPLHSLPQISEPPAIREHLRRWASQPAR